jgi:hypothetical protein
MQCPNFRWVEADDRFGSQAEELRLRKESPLNTSIADIVYRRLGPEAEVAIMLSQVCTSLVSQ